jgi:hypothetical protein
MKKRLLCIALITAFLLPASTLAAGSVLSLTDTPIIKPMYQDMVWAFPGLSVNGGTATYSLDVTGATNVTKITATLQIQRKNTNGVFADYGSSWSASANGYMLYTSGTKAVYSGDTYRLKATIQLYKGSSYSTETVYS